VQKAMEVGAMTAGVGAGATTVAVGAGVEAMIVETGGDQAALATGADGTRGLEVEPGAGLDLGRGAELAAETTAWTDARHMQSTV
jgi:hypothetical protein